ncbi:MAG: DUF3499 family protein [bacterium]|nr:DUF3499 family protein [bacterium]MDE0216688.1 DUF3499 family protein [bacterium]
MPGNFCARVSCGARASAILLINARDLAAHVVDIQEHTAVAGVPLCRAHADAVVVPLGWTLSDSRSPAAEPELVLIDDAASGSPGSSGVLRLPPIEEAEEEDMEEAAGGEIPPLLSRAFRAAGLD